MPGACSATCLWPPQKAMLAAPVLKRPCIVFGIYGTSPRSLGSLPAAHWLPPCRAAAARCRCLVLLPAL
jgi:hypothetical protein